MARHSLLLAASLLGSVFSQTQQAQFNQVINLNGDMNLNSITFPDGSRIETFSQSQRQLLVNQNQSPLPGNQVTGSTGEPFLALSQNSIVIQTNGANDLVGGQIELPINMQTLQSMGINMDNTFVAKLSSDRMSWMIMETLKSVNGTDNTVRIQKMTMIDGEYITLGRQTPTTGLALQQFSNQQPQAFNITGSGIQEQELTDGFRMSIRSSQPMTINTNVVNGIATTMLAGLPPGTNSINNFRYLVTTNLAGVLPNINRMVAVVQIPINPVRLQTIATQMGANANSNIRLSIAQRGVLINPGGAIASSGTTLNRRRRESNSNSTNTDNSADNSGISTSLTATLSGSSPSIFSSQATPSNSDSNTSGTNSEINGNNPAATQLLLAPTFTPIASNAVLDQINGRLAIPVSQLDGEYIITVQMANGTSGTVTGSGSAQGQEPAVAETLSTASVIGATPQPAGTINGTTGIIKRQLIPAGVLASQVASASPKATSTVPQADSPAPPAVVPQATAPQVASSQVTSLEAPAPATSTVLASAPTPATKEPTPSTAGIPDGNGGVVISMAWVNMMAQVAQQFLPVDVDQLMDQLAAQQGQTMPDSMIQGTGGDVGTGLLERHWVA